MIKATNYNGTKAKETTSFFIQSKGNKSGNPIKTPSANCFEISVDPNFLNADYTFYLFSHLFNTGVFQKNIKGSVIPFITKDMILKAFNDFMLNK